MPVTMIAPMEIAPVSLLGRHVRLEPLTDAHLDGLAEVGLAEELWRWIPFPVTTRQEMADYIGVALDEQRRGVSVPFAITEKSTGRPIGSTRFAMIDRLNHRLEIGWTWIAPAWQRTAVNTEAKFLMLCHAFERLNCLRVELKTDSLNEKSRKAIGRIGAQQEGIFRNHMLTASGRIRHTVYFSVIDSEWPSVRSALEDKLI